MDLSTFIKHKLDAAYLQLCYEHMVEDLGL